jgi:hypothetical protein
MPPRGKASAKGKRGPKQVAAAAAAASGSADVTSGASGSGSAKESKNKKKTTTPGPTPQEQQAMAKKKNYARVKPYLKMQNVLIPLTQIQPHERRPRLVQQDGVKRLALHIEQTGKFLCLLCHQCVTDSAVQVVLAYMCIYI